MRLNQLKEEMFNMICTVVCLENALKRNIVVYCLVEGKMYMLEIEN